MTSGSPQRPGTSTACYRRRISSAREGDLLFISIDIHDTQGLQLGPKSIYISSSSSPARNRSRLLASVKGRPASCPRLQKPHSDKTGGLNGSLQHLLAVYLPEFEIPKFFLDVDLIVVPPRRALLENILTILFF